MADEPMLSYDSALGGDIDVAPMVQLRDFGQHRIDEILMLAEAVNEPPEKGLLFQRLPKHMRRRQMSHHDSRLPRRLRFKIHTEAKPDPPKRPSRKYRRKPRNLLLDYNRRQREKVWLETHIWHAKRFHIIDKWGYRLGDRPTNKGFRANYRASSKHCLAIDISYMNCIELIGGEAVLLSGLQNLVNSACGLSFAAKSTLDGSREGSVILYHPQFYPRRVIGEVTFHWKPIEQEDEVRQMWLWVHPAILDEVVDCLKQVFSLTEKVQQSSVVTDTAETKEVSQLASKNVPFAKVPSFHSNLVEMNLLKDTLNRHRLIGPLSSSVLSDSLVVASFPEENDEGIAPAKRPRLDESVLCLENDQHSFDPMYHLRKIYADSDWRTCCEKQKSILASLKQLSSPTEVPPHSILSVLATDPRVSRPCIRKKSTPDPSSAFKTLWNIDLAKSAIWSSEVRDAVTTTKPTTWDLDKARSETVVAQEESSGAPVPLLLIQRPGCRGPNFVGYGSGWDVISPAGWGLPVWLSLIYRGARAGGLHELQGVRFESRNLREALQPDSLAGNNEALEIYNEEKKRYKSLPPAKRPNFNKLSIPSPFLPLWKELHQFWNENVEEETFVLRDLTLIRQISLAMDKRLPEELPVDPMLHQSLVHIVVTCKSGRPTKLAHLYLPSPNDLEVLRKGGSPPIEPSHTDERCKIRKEIIEEHRKRLRTQRRARKKERVALAEEVAQQPLGMKLPSGFVPKNTPKSRRNEEWEEELAKLWLPKPEDALKIMNATSRKLVGYVTSGDFAFTDGHGTGLGYVVFSSMVHLLKMCSESNISPTLLIRNSDQLQYRFCEASVVQ